MCIPLRRFRKFQARVGPDVATARRDATASRVRVLHLIRSQRIARLLFCHASNIECPSSEASVSSLSAGVAQVLMKHVPYPLSYSIYSGSHMSLKVWRRHGLDRGVRWDHPILHQLLPNRVLQLQLSSRLFRQLSPRTVETKSVWAWGNIASIENGRRGDRRGHQPSADESELP